MVSAIEGSFVPLLIINNKAGKDAELLKRFREPAWNYQVVRFLDAAGRDVIPRKDKVWKTRPLAERMVQALKKAKRKVPAGLAALATGQSAGAQLAFAMHCFWTGEMKLGQIDGVTLTEAGWLGGREVTLVTYDPQVISESALRKQAQSLKCADKVFSDLKGYRKARDSDQKRQLQGTKFAKLKLSPQQATKVNAWARVDAKKARRWLNAEQLKQLDGR